MSQQVLSSINPPAAPGPPGSPAAAPAIAAPAEAPRSFVSHARTIGLLTLISRVLGMLRESVAASAFGAGAVWSAFTVAFTIPNLFRKLFGEGALSAAFIPLYAQSVRRDSAEDSNAFANATVNLLCAILLLLTIVGEAALAGVLLVPGLRADYGLAVRLTMVMLPYVLLVCGTALLGGILQVRHRFGAPAATSIVSNVCLIVAIVLAARWYDLGDPANQAAAVYWLAVSVLISGVLQVAMLVPSLRAVGFRFRPIVHLWTPQIRAMLRLTLPVALSLFVLQISVLLDKAIALLLAGDAAHTHFQLMGWTIRYPMAEGAAARLNWAQFLYQFPLGVFAIALATAIFPRLSSDAGEADRAQFRTILRQGIEASLFIGLPASIGLILVREPAVRLLFQNGEFTASDGDWVALSTAIYSAGIWAFSIQQIVSRAYYALHDTLTPLIWGIVNLLINLAVELPLIWTGLGEAGLAAGTLAAFSIQAIAMLIMLDRRAGGLGLRQSVWPVLRMLAATAAMVLACLAVQRTPFYPAEAARRLDWLVQLTILSVVGAAAYFGACAAMGMNVARHVRLGGRRKSA